MNASKKVVRSLYKNLIKRARQFDSSPSLQNLLFDPAFLYDADKCKWQRVVDTPNLVATAVREGGLSLTDGVRKEFRKVDKVDISVGFRQLGLFGAALEVGKTLPPTPEPPAPAATPPGAELLALDELPEVFLLIMHPLAFFSDPVNNLAVLLVMSSGRQGVCKALALNTPFCVLGEILPAIHQLPPDFSALSEARVWAGGYAMQDQVQLGYLHPYSDIDGCLQLVPGVCKGGNAEAVAEAVAAETHPARPEDFTFFLGEQDLPLAFVEGLCKYGHAVPVALPADPFSSVLFFNRGAQGCLPGPSGDESYDLWRAACAAAHAGGCPHTATWSLFPPVSSVDSDVVVSYLDKISS